MQVGMAQTHVYTEEAWRTHLAWHGMAWHGAHTCCPEDPGVSQRLGGRPLDCLLQPLMDCLLQPLMDCLLLPSSGPETRYGPALDEPALG